MAKLNPGRMTAKTQPCATPWLHPDRRGQPSWQPSLVADGLCPRWFSRRLSGKNGAKACRRGPDTPDYYLWRTLIINANTKQPVTECIIRRALLAGAETVLKLVHRAFEDAVSQLA